MRKYLWTTTVTEGEIEGKVSSKISFMKQMVDYMRNNGNEDMKPIVAVDSEGRRSHLIDLRKKKLKFDEIVI